MNNTPKTANEAKKSYYPAPVRFSKISLFSTITVKPFWIVPFCLISGIILFLLRGFVLEIEKFYSFFNPLIIPLFIVGLGLIILRRVLYTDPRPIFNVAHTVGYIFLYLSLFLIFFLKCGYIALWAIPFDIISADTYRPEYMAAFAHNPAAVALYEKYIETVSGFEILRLDDGIGGLIINFKDYLIELIKNDELSLVNRAANAVVSLLIMFFGLVLIALVLPGFAILLPFVLAYFLCIVLDRLLRIWIEKPFDRQTVISVVDKFTKKGKV
ncbi:MAG: hypothetical protein IJF27_08005 [Oscillospiraceae bacterium]|nr:hypothetical protein [Oscillospiraceae bacterium]